MRLASLTATLMPIDDRILDLVRRPTESLNVELKNWLDPVDPATEVKLVKALFALRNRNGGYLALGFNNANGHPDPCPFVDKVRTYFHIDKVQAIVSKQASMAFDISIEFPELGGVPHPVIVVPDGVRVPVVAKSDVKDGDRYFIRKGDLYFRTLNANGIVSSALINPRDYPALMDVCFENREADIGRFFRRQLGTLDVERLRELLGILAQEGRFEGVQPQSAPADAPLEDPKGRKPLTASLVPSGPPRAFASGSVIDMLRHLTGETLSRGEKAFDAALRKRPLPADRSELIHRLTMRTALALDPQRPDALPTGTFMNKVDAANPQYTGWPAWLDSRSFSKELDRPQVHDNSWQANIMALEGGWADHWEFLKFDPRGSFFMRRVMQDDMSDKVEPGSALDPILMLYRVTEVIAVGISIARALDWQETDHAGFRFRWTGLAGRRLVPWVNRLSSIGHFGSAPAVDDAAESFVSLTLDVPHSALAPHVQVAIAPLFAAFGGYEPPPAVVENAIQQLVERRLSN